MRFLSFLMINLICLAMAASTDAQGRGKQNPNRAANRSSEISRMLAEATAKRRSSQEDPVGRISVKFMGGALADYVAIVRENIRSSKDEGIHRTAVSVVVAAGAEDFQLPSIQLDNVYPENAVTMLDGLTETENRKLTVRQSGEVIVISAVRNQKTISQQVTVLNVSDILKQYDEKQLLAAVEIGLKMQGELSSAAPLDIKLHKETGLLFLKGNHAQMGIVHEVVLQLKKPETQNLNAVK